MGHESCTTRTACDEPLVSVVVPAYNLMGYIGRCLDSLLAQDFEGYEVVCVDDGSTDGTGELLDRYAEENPRVRVFHFDNQGLSVARNRGVALARAELISFVDGDDVVSPHYLSMLHAAHDGSPGTMVRASTISLDPAAADGYTWSEPELTFMQLDGLAIGRAYLLDRLRVTAWGSLAHRSLYEWTPYVPGLVFEDVHALPDHVDQLSHMVVLDARLYGVVRRLGSLSRPVEPSRLNGIHYRVAATHAMGVAGQWSAMPRDFVEWKVARIHASIAVGGPSRKVPVLEELSNSLRAGAYVRPRLPRLVSLWRREGLSTKLISRMLFLAVAPVLYPAAAHVYHGARRTLGGK